MNADQLSVVKVQLFSEESIVEKVFFQTTKKPWQFQNCQGFFELFS